MEELNSQQILEKNNAAAEAATDIKVPDDLMDDISQGVRRKEGSDIARIVVDRQGCIGARSCTVVTEDLFQMDDENLAYVVDPESYDDETVKLSAESCPVLAIHLYDKEGEKIFPEM